MTDQFKDSQQRRGADKPKAARLSGELRQIVRKVVRKKGAEPSTARKSPEAKQTGDGCLVVGVLLTAILVWLTLNKFFL